MKIKSIEFLVGVFVGVFSSNIFMCLMLLGINLCDNITTPKRLGIEEIKCEDGSIVLRDRDTGHITRISPHSFDMLEEAKE